jgi:hypothetical protein
MPPLLSASISDLKKQFRTAPRRLRGSRIVSVVACVGKGSIWFLSAEQESCRGKGRGPIVGRMAARRSRDFTPDLFSASTTAKPTERPAVQPPRAEPDNASQPRHLLPKDLAGALARLDDAEIDALVAAVTAEAKRRSRPTQTPSEDPSTLARESQVGETAVEEGARLLKKGKLNAVRAAFRAGVKPATIARQFGISKSDVRKVIASDAVGRKSSR